MFGGLLLGAQVDRARWRRGRAPGRPAAARCRAASGLAEQAVVGQPPAQGLGLHARGLADGAAISASRSRAASRLGGEGGAPFARVGGARRRRRAAARSAAARAVSAGARASAAPGLAGLGDGKLVQQRPRRRCSSSAGASRAAAERLGGLGRARRRGSRARAAALGRAPRPVGVVVARARPGARRGLRARAVSMSRSAARGAGGFARPGRRRPRARGQRSAPGRRALRRRPRPRRRASARLGLGPLGVEAGDGLVQRLGAGVAAGGFAVEPLDGLARRAERRARPPRAPRGAAAGRRLRRADSAWRPRCAASAACRGGGRQARRSRPRPRPAGGAARRRTAAGLGASARTTKPSQRQRSPSRETSRAPGGRSGCRPVAVARGRPGR